MAALFYPNLKKRHKNLFLFKGGQEHLAMHRGGQGLFLKQREKAGTGHVAVCITATYMSKH